MCRFDPSVEQDKNNYFFVEGNLSEMCEVASKQGQLVMSSSGILPDILSPGVASENDLRRRLDAL
jgi:hypothetical protein